MNETILKKKTTTILKVKLLKYEKDDFGVRGFYCRGCGFLQ
jgi:hypothetical protein